MDRSQTLIHGDPLVPSLQNLQNSMHSHTIPMCIAHTGHAITMNPLRLDLNLGAVVPMAVVLFLLDELNG